MGQKHKRFRESRMPFPLRDIHKNPRSIYARVPQAMAQFFLKIEQLSHIMGPTPILEMTRACGLRPLLWLLRQGLFKTVRALVLIVKFNFKTSNTSNLLCISTWLFGRNGEGRWRLHLLNKNYKRRLQLFV